MGVRNENRRSTIFIGRFVRGMQKKRGTCSKSDNGHKKAPAVLYSRCAKSCHVGKAFNRFCKVLDGLVRVPVFDPIAYTVLDMALQNNLADLVQR